MPSRTSKTVPKKRSRRPANATRTLKNLIARTNTIADKTAELLGKLRELETQGFVITTLVSGKSKQG